MSNSQSNPYGWVILALACSSFLVTFVARFTWPPLIPVMVPVLGMSMSQAGAYMTAFYLGYLVNQIPGGILADRFGSRFILGCSVILAGIATFAMGWIKTYEVGFALRLVTGIVAGGVFASCTHSLVEWFPLERRGIAFGFLMAMPSGGVLVANIFVPVLNSWIGWQRTFQTVGLLLVAVGVLVVLFMRSCGNVKMGRKSLLGGFKVISRSRGIALTAIAGFCLMWLSMGIVTWGNTYVKQLGFSLREAGFVMMMFGVGGIATNVVVGAISDWIGHPKVIVLALFTMAIPVCIIFGHQESLFSLSAIALLLGCCTYGPHGLLIALISQFAGKEWAATVNGTTNAIWQSASMIVPLVLGFSIDITGNFSVIWWLLAAGPLVGAFLLLPVNEKEGLIPSRSHA